MIPYICQTKHDPDNGTYGDCVRACVASILETSSPFEVPHEFREDDNGAAGQAALRAYLASRGLAIFMFAFDASMSLEQLLAGIADQTDGHYILTGATAYGDHAVVGKGGEIVHNPHWTGVPIIKPLSVGQWQVWVLAVK